MEGANDSGAANLQVSVQSKNPTWMLALMRTTKRNATRRPISTIPLSQFEWNVVCLDWSGRHVYLDHIDPTG